MIVSRAEPVATLRIMASTAILGRCQMASGLAGCDPSVMALRTTGVLCWERDITQGPEAAVIHRRVGKTPAGRVTVATALAGCSSVNIDENLRGSGRALNG
jgi:hypothetical protein